MTPAVVGRYVVLGTYVVEADDVRLDRLAKALYGSERGGAVERLLAANPGLAAQGAFDPRGTRLVVPAAPVPSTAPNPRYVRPWM